MTTGIDDAQLEVVQRRLRVTDTGPDRRDVSPVAAKPVTVVPQPVTVVPEPATVEPAVPGAVDRR